MNWKINRDPYYKGLYTTFGLKGIEEAGYFDDTATTDFDIKSSVRILCTPIEPISKKITTSPNPCVLLTTGSFCPIHQGHIDMVVAARKAVENAGYQVLAGYVSAGHDEYINLKTKDKAIPIHHRIDLIQQLIEENDLQDWLMPDAWEGIFNQVAVNFTDVVYRLELYLEELFGQKIPVFFICGGDNARFAMTFMQKGNCVVVGRPGYEERFNLYKNKLAACPNIVWAEGFNALSSTQIRAKENFTSPALRHLYLRIENQDERVAALLEILKPYFQSIQCTYLSEQEAVYKKISPADTISLDAYLPGNFNLELSRVYDLMGWRQLGYTNRPGSNNLKSQIAAIPKGAYCLFDDDIHTGNTMKFAQNLLEKEGIKICAILAMNLYQKKNYTATEVLDCRDFLVGGIHNGLVVKIKDKEVRVPYLYPYVCPWIRASIPQPMVFSIQVWTMNSNYYQKYPTKLGDCAVAVQTLFGLIGFSQGDSLSDICQWHVDLLCEFYGY